MKLLHPGTWWIRSESDPRWNTSGRADVGLFTKPSQLEERMKTLQQKLGEPPSDLEWGYEKD